MAGWGIGVGLASCWLEIQSVKLICDAGMIKSTEKQFQSQPIAQPARAFDPPEPRVSVIIPNYNHGQYVGQAILSVLNQNYNDYEIIVVDDGSTDNSREVVGQFKDRVRYIWQENQGLSAARNTGIRAAQGEYIGLLDADDMYEPDFFSRLVTILETNPDAGAVHCGYRFVDHSNNPLPQVEARQIPPEQMFKALVESNFLVPESMFVRRRCYEKVGLFDESLRALEDWDMWLRIASQFTIIGTAKVLTRHRILPGSMSTDPVRMLNNRLAVLQKHFGVEPHGIEVELKSRRRAYGHAYLTSSIEYLQCGDKEHAYECIQKISGTYPELLVQLDTFYQLGCGDQPKGYLGHFDSLDLQRNGKILFEMLDKLFDDPNLVDRLERYRQSAYANANLALGLLYYGADQIGQARSHLIRGIATDPKCGVNGKVIKTLLKTFLGLKLLTWLKRSKLKEPKTLLP